MDYSNDIDTRYFDRNLHLNYLKIIKNDDITKYNNIINPQNDIIISIPEKERNIHILNNGTLGLTSLNDVNLTQLISNTFFHELKLNIQLKISTPYGILLNHKLSDSNTFINAIYPDIKRFDRSFNFNTDNKKENDDFVLIYTIYNSFSFILYLDLKQYKNYNTSLIMSKNIKLIELYFTPIIHISKSGLPLVNNIYIIYNDEYYKQFEDIF